MYVLTDPSDGLTGQRFERMGNVLRLGCLATPSEESVYRQGALTVQGQRHESGDVQKITFIARRSKLRALRGYGHELDGAESVGQMNGENGDQQKYG
jgi:hypothetical protein